MRRAGLETRERGEKFLVGSRRGKEPIFTMAQNFNKKSANLQWTTFSPVLISRYTVLATASHFLRGHSGRPALGRALQLIVILKPHPQATHFPPAEKDFSLEDLTASFHRIKF
jgi:hypothetical protein